VTSLPDRSADAGVASLGHAGEHVPVNRGTREQRALWAALVANTALLVAEAVGGIAFGSLALLADAGHLLTDVLSLGVAVAPLRLARRAPNAKHTFGFERAEVLAAQVNSLLLVGVMVWIVMEAAHRLRDPGAVDAAGMLAIACVALIVNTASAFVLARAAGKSLNMRGAYLHLATDAVGSLAAIAAALLILGWGLLRADPIASLVTAPFVAWAAFGLVSHAGWMPRRCNARSSPRTTSWTSTTSTYGTSHRSPRDVRAGCAHGHAIARRRAAPGRRPQGDARRRVRDPARDLRTRVRRSHRTRGSDTLAERARATTACSRVSGTSPRGELDPQYRSTLGDRC
jgi:Co/Zn/Cd efflux system component